MIGILDYIEHEDLQRLWDDIYYEYPISVKNSSVDTLDFATDLIEAMIIDEYEEAECVEFFTDLIVRRFQKQC